MEYLFVKWVHIVSSTILFGTGIGSAFYVYMANRSRDTGAIHFALSHVVVADWIFTTPSVIVQLFTGGWLVYLAGYQFDNLWIRSALSLYLFAGVCWLPVVWLQIRMRNIASLCLKNDEPLPSHYWKYNWWWIVLGSLAFPSVIVIFYLMVFKPG